MYLVEKPEHDDYDSIIENHYEEIFELNLKKWVQDWESWPKNRSYAMFLEWFNVKVDADFLLELTLDDGNQRSLPLLQTIPFRPLLPPQLL